MEVKIWNLPSNFLESSYATLFLHSYKQCYRFSLSEVKTRTNHIISERSGQSLMASGIIGYVKSIYRQLKAINCVCL